MMIFFRSGSWWYCSAMQFLYQLLVFAEKAHQPLGIVFLGGIFREIGLSDHGQHGCLREIFMLFSEPKLLEQLLCDVGALGGFLWRVFQCDNGHRLRENRRVTGKEFYLCLNIIVMYN
jgi:hypothetical protein